MSEKTKGVIGSETRPEDVVKWLIDHGATCTLSGKPVREARCNDPSQILYVRDDGCVDWISVFYEQLFDIEEIPRWRAEEGKEYYYASDDGYARLSRELGDEFDEGRYKIGNYFKTKEEAEPYAEEIRKVFNNEL